MPSILALAILASVPLHATLPAPLAAPGFVTRAWRSLEKARVDRSEREFARLTRHIDDIQRGYFGDSTVYDLDPRRILAQVRRTSESARRHLERLARARGWPCERDVVTVGERKYPVVRFDPRRSPLDLAPPELGTVAPGTFEGARLGYAPECLFERNAQGLYFKSSGTVIASLRAFIERRLDPITTHEFVHHGLHRLRHAGVDHPFHAYLRANILFTAPLREEKRFRFEEILAYAGSNLHAARGGAGRYGELVQSHQQLTEVDGEIETYLAQARARLVSPAEWRFLVERVTLPGRTDRFGVTLVLGALHPPLPAWVADEYLAVGDLPTDDQATPGANTSARLRGDEHVRAAAREGLASVDAAVKLGLDYYRAIWRAGGSELEPRRLEQMTIEFLDGLNRLGCATLLAAPASLSWE